MQCTINNVRRQLAATLNPELARILMADILSLSLTELLLQDEKALDDTTVRTLLDAARRVKDGEPLQYVSQKAYFLGDMYYVDPSVLIPRPETEQIISLIPPNPTSILDIGTGSGCIAISAKKQFPNAAVSAIDISPDALEVARHNAITLQQTINFQQVDILNDTINQTFDVVISNPPYVLEREKNSIEPHVLNHEPHLALFVPNDDPLRFYRAIASRCAKSLLAPQGTLIFEINEALPNETSNLLRSLGFSDIKLHKDFLSAPRFIICKKQ